MSCIRPLELINKWYYPLYNNKNYYTGESKKTILVPCNSCIGCLIAKQQALEFLSTRELLSVYKRHESASFVTLTYSDENLPKSHGMQTLSKRDAQLFHKRLRILLKRAGITQKYKYILCGEYGDGSHATDTAETTHRPHIHFATFGLSPEQLKPFIMKAWQRKGIIDIGPLTQGGIRYIISYMEKQQTTPEIKELYKVFEVEPPFLTHSIGIGKEWIIENMENIVRQKGTFNLNGKIELFPRYILDFVCNHYSIDTRSWIKDFFLSQKTKNQTLKQYLEINEENNFVKLQYKICALQSRNKPITKEDLDKKYLRPIHNRLYVERKTRETKQYINTLVKEALL